MARIMPALEFRSFHSHRSCENVPNTTLFTTLPCADSHPRRGPRSLVALSVPSRKNFALRLRVRPHRAPPFPLCRGAIGPGLRGVARRATPAHRVTYIHIPRTPDMKDGRQARRVSRRDALHVTSVQRPTTQDGEYYPVPLYPERSPQRPGSCVDSAAPGSSPIHWIEYVGDR